MGIYQIEEELTHINVIKLFANNEDGRYGDIYTSEQEFKIDYPGEEALRGFGLIDKRNSMTPDGAPDWIHTLEEAIELAKKTDIRHEDKVQQKKKERAETLANYPSLTVGALREILNEWAEQNPEIDKRVLYIPAKPNQPVLNFSGVTLLSASLGFDWDSRKVLLSPREGLLVE